MPWWDEESRVTGEAKYAADLDFPGMLWGKLLYAPVAPARIKRIDLAGALAMDGVVDAVTAADVPGSPFYCYAVADMPILALDVVRYRGEAVAAVAAVTEELAEQALQRIVVEYEPIEGVFDPLEAMSERAPRVQAGKDNVIDRLVIKRGDVNRGFAEAAVVVERTYRTSWAEHAFIETEAAVAALDQEGQLIVYSSTQAPHRDRKQLASILGLPESSIRVKVPPVGGAFGGKAELHVQPHAAVLAWRTRRPVKVVRTREESVRAHIKRHPMTIRYKSGVSADGRITAIDVRIVGDTGPYTNSGLEVVGCAVESAPGPYEVPNAYLEGATVLTNNPPCGAMRGFGIPQVTFASEQQMDLLAASLGMDPLEIRLKNALVKGSVMATGAEVYQPAGLREVLTEGARVARWEDRTQLERRPLAHLRRGIGLACCWQATGFGTGAPDFAAVQMELGDQGRVEVRCGAADMGQGLPGVVLRLAADELGLPVECINYVGPDTDVTPDCLSSEASRQTYVTGNATLDAARSLRAKILQTAGQMVGRPQEELGLEGGKIVGYRSEETYTLMDVMRFAEERGIRIEATGSAKMPTADQKTITFPFAHSYFSCGANIAQVLVDIKTGMIEIERMIAVQDVGRAINPKGVLGQIEGGCVMGCGWALMEELVYLRDECLTPSLREYLVPTAMDVPEIVPVIVEDPDPQGPRGAKGIGEATMSSTAAAIANAVANALGIRTYSIPMTPERVLSALAGWDREDRRD